MSLFHFQVQDPIYQHVLHLVVMSHQSHPVWRNSSVFLCFWNLWKSETVQAFPSVEAMSTWCFLTTKYKLRILGTVEMTICSSQPITSRSTLAQPVPPLVMLTVIIWPRWCLPNFATEISPCFHVIWLHFCGKIYWYFANMLFLMKPPPTREHPSATTNLCQSPQLWWPSGEYVPPSFSLHFSVVILL